MAEVLLSVHRNRRLIRDGSPGRPPRHSHSSRILFFHHSGGTGHVTGNSIYRSGGLIGQTASQVFFIILGARGISHWEPCLQKRGPYTVIGQRDSKEIFHHFGGPGQVPRNSIYRSGSLIHQTASQEIFHHFFLSPRHQSLGTLSTEVGAL